MTYRNLQLTDKRCRLCRLKKESILHILILQCRQVKLMWKWREAFAFTQQCFFEPLPLETTEVKQLQAIIWSRKPLTVLSYKYMNL